MAKIFKYPLRFETAQHVKMPVGAKILDVQLQNGIPCLWALVNEENCECPYEIITLGTGKLVSAPKTLHYLGTIVMPREPGSEEDFVWHFFLREEV